jgi:hypothetical protein
VVWAAIWAIFSQTRLVPLTARPSLAKDYLGDKPKLHSSKKVAEIVSID